MSGNIIIAAGVFLLAIQLERIALAAASPTPADDLESLKTNAVKEITKINAKFLSDFQEMIGDIEDGYHWIASNDSFLNRVKETAGNSIANIDQLAEELVQQGKTEGKSEEYFSCVKEHRNNVTEDIEEESYNYVEVMQMVNGKAMVNIEKCLRSLEKLLEAVEDFHKTYVVQINLCQDQTCVSEVLEEAKDMFGRSDVLLHSIWKRSIRIILHFKAVARERQLEAEQTILELMKNGQDNMKRC